VRLTDGTVGWVSSQHVVREGAAARPRGNCPPDSDYSFITTPKPAFSDSAAHGIVVIEAGVDAKGNVLSTRVVSNSTGDDALAALTQQELRAAKFAPPVRNCAAKPFVYTYKRAF
jgi:TonB family protein